MILCTPTEPSFSCTYSASATNSNRSIDSFEYQLFVIALSPIKTQEITYEREKLREKPGMNRQIFNLLSMSLLGAASQ